MKGGKKRTSSLDSGRPVLDPTTTVNGVGLLAEEEKRRNRSASEKVAAPEESMELEDGDEEDSEAEKEYENSENQQTEDAEAEEGEGEGERTKLADGYYEIETVRRKRVRKGQIQYLIKWRGWSEAANTWEPVENLVQCADIIEAFEESLKAGKSRSTRKRKRKTSTTNVQIKKKQQQPQQQRSPAAATYNVPSHVVRIANDPVPFPRLNDADLINENKEINANGVNGVVSNKVNENGLRTVSTIREEKMEPNELDPKIFELKGATTSSMDDAGKLTVASQEDQQTAGDASENGLRKTDEREPVQSGRCTGAKKRKSGSVKRFKKDPASCSFNDTLDTVVACPLVSIGSQNPEVLGNNTSCKNKLEDSKSTCTITQIIKPISYKASYVANNIQEVLVAFEAVRSDGTKVTVDNKFLKANNPLLLIEFYEKHLRYNPT